MSGKIRFFGKIDEQQYIFDIHNSASAKHSILIV